jgi:hypothetical protein
MVTARASNLHPMGARTDIGNGSEVPDDGEFDFELR